MIGPGQGMRSRKWRAAKKRYNVTQTTDSDEPRDNVSLIVASARKSELAVTSTTER